MTVSNVAAGNAPPDMFSTMGNMLGMARNAQAMQYMGQQIQQAEIQTQQQQQAWGEAQAVKQIFAQHPELIKPDGTIDVAAAAPMISAVAPLTVTQQLQKIAQTNSASTAANQAQLSYGQEEQKQIGEALGALKGGTKSDIAIGLDNLQQQYPKLGQRISLIQHQIGQVPDGNQTGLDALLQHNIGITQTLQQQQEYGTPNLVGVNTGQTQNFFNIKPGVPGSPVGALVANFQNELPPTATTMQGNQPTYVGAQPTIGKTFAAAPALGQAETVIGTGVAPVAADWQKTLADAGNAAQNIGVLQNIKRYAPGALTGVASDRAAYISGLASYLGIEPAELAKTNTDLLAKNSKMLALAGGNTDAARSLAEAMNPHTTMTADAITHAADQIIAQQALPLVKQQVFSKVSGNPSAYQQQLTKWNQVADPRILQWSSMTPQEKAATKAAMSPQEQAKFRTQMQGFESLVGK